MKSIDFIHQIKRIALRKTKSNGWFLFKGMIVGLDDFRKKADKFSDILTQKVKGLQAPDDFTLVIELTRPYPQMLYVLAMSFASPIPYEAIEYNENNIHQFPVGTGPFKMVKWNRGLNVILQRNEQYRDAVYPSEGDSLSVQDGLLKDKGKKIPFLDRIEFKIIKEDQTRWLNFLSKKIDFLGIPKDNFNTAITPSGDLSPELKGKNVSLQITPSLTSWWVAFNMNHPILGKKVKLRKAVAHAIDIEKYLKLFTNDTGKKANSIFLPEIAGYDPETKVNFEFNLETAKRLMKEAGYPHGRGLPAFSYDVRGSSTVSRQQGEYIKKSLEEIGIQVNVVVNTFPGFLKKLREGNLQIWLDGWTLDYPDAENLTRLLSSSSHPPGPNHSFYHDKEVDGWIEELAKLPNGKEKFLLMKKIEKSVARDRPWIPLFYRRSYVLSWPSFKNFRKSDLVGNYLKYIRVQ